MTLAFRIRALACAALLTVMAVRASAGGLPDWAQSAVAAASRAPAGAHAHQLLLEQTIHVPAKGRITTTERAVLRILDRQGGAMALVAVPYNRTSARVSALRAWLVSTDGRVREFKRSDTLDRSLTESAQLESESRQLVLDPGGAAPGDLFAWEWEVEEEVLFAERTFGFGSLLPCAVQRFDLELPSGCQPRVLVSNGQVPVPQRTKRGWRWERINAPALPAEIWSAAWPAWGDYVVVVPDPMTAGPTRSFADWPDVGRWLESVARPSLAQTPELTSKAHQLADSSEDPVARASALARYTQSVNYLAISVGLARGEGYRPRPAATVLGTGYGDCKDKAGLFCALARALGGQAWLVSASLKGRDAVRDGWPSPAQFDHCIAALSVPPGTGLEAAVEDTPLGPLVFFDATRPDVPFGHLSEALAGSAVLLEDAEHSRLLRLPLPPPERDLSSSVLTGSLDERGTLTAEWQLVQHGARAWEERRVNAASASQWREQIEERLADWLGPCHVSRLEAIDRPDSGTFTVRATLVAERYAKPLGGNLVGFRTPSSLGPLRWNTADTTRLTPVALPAVAQEDSFALRVPAGWSFDALPKAVRHDAQFASVSGMWSDSGSELRVSVRARISPVTLPPERYRDWRAALGAWAYVNRTQVVAIRP